MPPKRSKTIRNQRPKKPAPTNTAPKKDNTHDPIRSTSANKEIPSKNAAVPETRQTRAQTRAATSKTTAPSAMLNTRKRKADADAETQLAEKTAMNLAEATPNASISNILESHVKEAEVENNNGDGDGDDMDIDNDCLCSEKSTIAVAVLKKNKEEDSTSHLADDEGTTGHSSPSPSPDQNLHHHDQHEPNPIPNPSHDQDIQRHQQDQNQPNPTHTHKRCESSHNPSTQPHTSLLPFLDLLEPYMTFQRRLANLDEVADQLALQAAQEVLVVRDELRGVDDGDVFRQEYFRLTGQSSRAGREGGKQEREVSRGRVKKERGMGVNCIGEMCVTIVDNNKINKNFC